MRTHSDSIINIYKLTDDGKKKLIAEKVLAKLETKKNITEINNFGKRTFEKNTLIFFDRRTIKPYLVKDVNWTTFQIQRIKVGKFEVDEWFMVNAPTMFEGKILPLD